MPSLVAGEPIAPDLRVMSLRDVAERLKFASEDSAYRYIRRHGVHYIVLRAGVKGRWRRGTRRHVFVPYPSVLQLQALRFTPRFRGAR